MPVAVSVAFTCAFGTEPPDGSVTVPLMAPRNVCAFAPTPNVKITNNARNNRLILPPPLIEFSEQLTSARAQPAPQYPAAARSPVPTTRPCFESDPSPKTQAPLRTWQHRSPRHLKH